MNDDKPSIFTDYEYVHHATKECTSCSGDGNIGSFVCGACNGEGAYTLGCNGAAAIDPLHPALGADCMGCGHLVPLEEVTHGGTSVGD